MEQNPNQQQQYQYPGQQQPQPQQAAQQPIPPPPPLPPSTATTNDEQQEKTFKMTWTETEIMQELIDLENDEEMALFLKVQRGALKYEKYKTFSKLIPRQS